MGSKQEIKEYKNGLQTALEAQFPALNVTVFKMIEENIDVPAIIVNPPFVDPQIALNTTAGKFTATLQNQVFVCYDLANEENEIECLLTTSYLANFINKNNFGLKMPAAKVTACEPTIIQGFENLIIYRIDFEQNITITENS